MNTLGESPHQKSPLASLQSLKGVGPKLSARLASLGIHTLEDLLLHLPTRYQYRGQPSPIGTLEAGDEASVVGEIIHAEVIQRQRRFMLLRLQDNSGTLTLRFFHFSAAQRHQLQTGTQLYCHGELRQGSGTLEMIHPEYRCLDADDSPQQEQLLAVYPTTEGLGQFQWRSMQDQALTQLEAQPTLLPEYLPDALRQRLQLPPLETALQCLHQPAVTEPLPEGLHPARQRLVFEELLAHHLSLRVLHWQRRQDPAPAFTAAPRLSQAFQEALPFALTTAQQRVMSEIHQDLHSTRPMLRLLQGDVGSGKTVVAAWAVLRAVESGFQAAVMAPTELLSEQHQRNFEAWLSPLGITVIWLVGRLGKRARESALAAIADGSAPVVVGTHALFQEGVNFHRLGLVVIDEQHRFGVHQRLALRDKGTAPHQLVMTATPIPRTLAMSVYADLDTSVIDQLPPGRTPVRTVAMSQARRDEVIQRVRLACQGGRQAYWVCPLIDESEVLNCQAASELAEQLVALLPELQVGLVHGRLKATDKAQAMADFQSGQTQLLVATTVIEVGVDVPNASLMIIENAERLGLSQLHQLRGRVGRGSAVSHCVLLYRPPLSETARTRLGVLRDSQDGFVIARQDLQLRGPGEVLGTRQTGSLGMRIADFLRDEDWLPTVHAEADALLRDHPDAAQGLIRRWVGEGGRYGQV